MPTWLILLCCSTCLAPVSAWAQDSTGCRKFVQDFYDWYMRNGQSLNTALRRKPEVFEPGLLKALRLDQDAARRSPGELVGLDIDPITGSQDPADHYAARRVTWRGKTCLVEMWRASPNDTAEPLNYPEAVAEVIRDPARGWRISNFRYDQGRFDLLHLLSDLRKSRQKN